MKVNSRVLINKCTGKLLYNSFVPRPLQEVEKELIYDFQFLQTLINTKNAISKLNALTKRISNFNKYLEYHVKKEAVFSSLISDIKIDISNVFKNNFDDNTEPNYQQVKNCYNTIIHGINKHNTPITQEYLKELHQILIDDIDSQPGKLRTGRFQRYFWKMPPFEPPHAEEAYQALCDLEKYINEESSIDTLIKASLIYYQFNTIRPFHDGNERLSRILISLFMLKENVLENNVIYLSYYFKKNLNELYKHLDDVRDKGDYIGWITFFLLAVQKTANLMYVKLEELVKLNCENRIKINNSKYSKTIKNNLMLLLEYLQDNPIIDIKNSSRDLNKTYPTIAFIVEVMVELNILELVNDYHRNRQYYYKQYIEILKKQQVKLI